MKERLSRKGKITQRSYDLPHRVHAAQIYPETAPNGSTIIIYGHGSGVRVLWRGGRRLKQPSASKDRELANGADEDSRMAVDDDDEQIPKDSTEQAFGATEYEPEEEEYDPTESSTSIVQHMDLILHTEVLQIAIPHMPPASVVRPDNSVPTALAKRMVFAVACSDCSIRVITLPLEPPSAAKVSSSKCNEHIITITSQSGHQNIPNSLSVTWTSREVTPTVDFNLDEDEDMESDQARDQRIAARYQNHEWDLLVASHSNELDGLLRINRICVGGDGALSSSSQPSQTLYLSSPASHIGFNPSFHPSKRHSHLFVADERGTLRIYDPLAPSRSRPQSSRALAQGSQPKLGIWISSFNTPFANQTGSAPGTVCRKRILAASWALHGNAIIMLLRDGEWGFWSLNARGPAPGVSRDGGTVASFAMRGFIGTVSTSSLNAEQTHKARNSRNSLAPMTPNTRKTKQESLFSGPASHVKDSPPLGGISISQGREGKDESVLMWYNNEIHSIPSLQAYWHRASGGGGSLTGPGIQRLEGLDTQGEIITSVQDIIPNFSSKNPATSPQADRLVVAERRLVILSVGQRPDVEKAMALFRREEEHAMQEEGFKIAERNVDQRLLAKGDLDVGGIDRLLDGMNGNAAEGTTTRKVGFAAQT